MDDIVKQLDDMHEITGQAIFVEAADEIVMRRLLAEKLFNSLVSVYESCDNLKDGQLAVIRESIDCFVMFNEINIFSES